MADDGREKDARLGAQLRKNLKRRKEQQRDRGGGGLAPPLTGSDRDGGRRSANDHEGKPDRTVDCADGDDEG